MVNPIRVFYQNVRGRKNITPAITRACEEKAQIILLCETWIVSDSAQVEKAILSETFPDYVVSLFCHPKSEGKRRCSGMLVMIQTDLFHSQNPVFSPSYPEWNEPPSSSMFVSVDFSGIPSLMFVYLDPSVKPGELILWRKQFEAWTNQRQHQPCFMIGDFNGHSQDWSSMQPNDIGNMLEHFLQECGFLIVNRNVPTHELGGTNDLLITPPAFQHNFRYHVLPLDISDHCPIVVDVETSISPNNAKSPNTVKTYKRTDWELFKLKVDNFCLQFFDELHLQNFFIRLAHHQAPNAIEKEPSIMDSFVNEEQAKRFVQFWIERFSNHILLSSASSSTTISKHHDSGWWKGDSSLVLLHRELRKLCNKINSLRKKKKDVPDELIKRRNEVRVNYRQTLNQAKQSFLSNKIDSINNIPKDPRKAWREIMSLVKPKERQSLPLINHPVSDSAPGSDQESAENMASFYQNVFSHPSLSQEQSERISKTEAENRRFLSEVKYEYNSIPSISPNEVRAAISSMDSNTSPGVDQISMTHLLNLPDLALKFLASIFNFILFSGHFPNQWKIAVVSCLFKPKVSTTEARRKASNYRPISVTPILARVFERCILSRFEKCVGNNLNHQQFGFRSFHRAHHHVFYLLNQIHRSFKIRKHLPVLFVDLAQAYDKVSHPLLIKKLIEKKIDPLLIRLINNFLSDRFFKIKNNNITSSLRPVKVGLPQGAVLSPILFNIFIDDLLPDIEAFTSSGVGLVTGPFYADDFALFSTSLDLVIQLQHLQLALQIINYWCEQNIMKVNVSKTNIVIFTRNPQEIPKILNEHQINPVGLIYSRNPAEITNPSSSTPIIKFVESYTYLGFPLNQSVAWLSLKEALLKKTQQRAALVFKIIEQFPSISLNTVRILCASFIPSSLPYFLPVIPSEPSDKFFRKLDRAILSPLISKCKLPVHCSYSRIQYEFNIPSSYDRRRLLLFAFISSFRLLHQRHIHHHHMINDPKYEPLIQAKDDKRKIDELYFDYVKQCPRYDIKSDDKKEREQKISHLSIFSAPSLLPAPALLVKDINDRLEAKNNYDLILQLPFQLHPDHYPSNSRPRFKKMQNETCPLSKDEFRLMVIRQQYGKSFKQDSIMAQLMDYDTHFFCPEYMKVRPELATAWCRIRLQYSNLNDDSIRDKPNQVPCPLCKSNSPQTISHILFDCIFFSQIRMNHKERYRLNNINFNIQNILLTPLSKMPSKSQKLLQETKKILASDYLLEIIKTKQIKF